MITDNADPRLVPTQRHGPNDESDLVMYVSAKFRHWIDSFVTLSTEEMLELLERENKLSFLSARRDVRQESD